MARAGSAPKQKVIEIHTKRGIQVHVPRELGFARKAHPQHLGSVSFRQCQQTQIRISCIWLTNCHSPSSPLSSHHSVHHRPLPHLFLLLHPYSLRPVQVSCVFFKTESLLKQKAAWFQGFVCTLVPKGHQSSSSLPHHPAPVGHDIAAYFQINTLTNSRSTGSERTFEICCPWSKPLFFARHSCAFSSHASLPACVRTYTYLFTSKGGSRPGGDALDIFPLRPGPAAPISSRHGGWRLRSHARPQRPLFPYHVEARRKPQDS